MSDSMKPIQGYHLIKPEDLHWRPSNLMRIPNADFLELSRSENLSARLWRYPAKSANTLHKHIRAEEFYFVLEGTGRLRVGDETLTVPRYGGVLVCPDQLRQVFNDTDAEESRAEPQHYGSLRSPSCCGSANSVNHVVSTSVSDVVRTFTPPPYQ